MSRLAGLVSEVGRTALRDEGCWHVVLGLVYLRRFWPEVGRELWGCPDPSSLQELLPRTFVAVDLPDVARAAEGLTAASPPVWHFLTRVCELLGVIVPTASTPIRGNALDLMDVFDYAFDRLAEEVRYAFVTPRSIASLVAELVGPLASGEHCYDPFCRTGELLAELLRKAADGHTDHLEIGGAHPSPVMVELARMNVNMHASSDLADGLAVAAGPVWGIGSFDIVVTNPPFGPAGADEGGQARYGVSRRAEIMWLQSVVQSLGEHGRGAIVMPNAAATARGVRDRAVRRALIEDGAVAAVVALPSNLFSETAIGVMLWLVRRPTGKPSDVLFVDAQTLGQMSSRTRRELQSGDIRKIVDEYRRWQAAREDGTGFVPTPAFSRAVASDAIATHDYSLFPPAYVQPNAIGSDGSSADELRALYQELVRLSERARDVDTRVAEMLERLGER